MTGGFTINGYWKKTSKKPSLTITIVSDEYGSTYTAAIETNILQEIQRAFEKVEVILND